MIFTIFVSILGVLTFVAWKLRADPAGEKSLMPVPLMMFRIASTLLLAVVLVWNVVQIVPVGNVAVATLYGSVRDSTYGPGIHIVNPFYSFHRMSIQRRIIEFQSGPPNAKEGEEKEGEQRADVVAVSNDNLPLTIDVTYAISLNPTYASWLYRNIGDEDRFFSELVTQAARAATRSATARFDYTQATTTKRDSLAKAMEEDFRERIVNDLAKMGMPRQDAERVFTILPVQLRKVLPPEKVLNSIAEKAASEQDLQRQNVLTNIARQEAERRAQEGSGVKKLFEQLPAGFTSAEIAQVLYALGYKERSDAMMKAVETGKVNTIVMDGGNAPALSVGGAR